ncbi:hypothetical protein PR048_013427 [Dryococelus australis]|uniref:HTH psq-type domain-containing protein n=1 Tax=Dryococelus australis TaxID=614101 RepID=A0ABQ9HSJ8_9NEOP|nr:hypothetical protein PR048_013427 [Dryococelus australis]
MGQDTWIKKTNKRNWDKEKIEAAIHAVREGRMECNMAAATYGIPEATLRIYRNTDPEFVDTAGPNHPFNKQTKMAGEDWVISFITAYNFSMRAPEATSFGRTIGFNPVQVGKFFDLLNISATGVYVPHFLIFPRKRMRAELLHDFPPGSGGHANKTGWMNSELFVAYLQHFVNHIFAEEDFVLSATTERDIQAEPSHDQPTIALSGQQAAAVEGDLPLQHIIMQPGTFLQEDQPEVAPDEAENLTHISESNDNGSVPKPTTSRGQVSLNSIKPFPVANRPIASKRKRPNVSASILTSTPVKDFLLGKEHNKEKKSKKKEERNAKIAAKKLFENSTKPQENTEPILYPGYEEEFVALPMKTG